MLSDAHLLLDSSRLYVTLDYRSGVARDAGLDKEVADIDANTTHKTNIRVVKLDFCQDWDVALLAMSNADKCSAKEAQGTDVNTDD